MNHCKEHGIQLPELAIKCQERTPVHEYTVYDTLLHQLTHISDVLVEHLTSRLVSVFTLTLDMQREGK